MEKEGKGGPVCGGEKEGEQVGQRKQESWREKEKDEGHRQMGEDTQNEGGKRREKGGEREGGEEARWEGTREGER